MKINYKNKINCFLSLCVFLIGLIGIIGWILDIDFLKSIRPDWATLKPISAVLLMVSGCMLFSVNHILYLEEKVRKMIVAFFVFFSFFIVFLLSFNTLQSIFLPELYPYARDEVLTVYPQFPSLASVFCFLLIGIRGFTYLFDTNKVKLVRFLGFMILGISASSLIGLLIDNPYLCFYHPGRSTAMGFLPTVGFLFSSFILINRKKNDGSKKLQ